jgi:hypothetical protein
VSDETGDKRVKTSTLRAEFKFDVTSASDPANATAVRGGRAVTTLLSRWLHMRCVACGHTFGPVDEVEISADGTARHEGALFTWAGGGMAEAVPPAVVAEFFDRLDKTWAPPAGISPASTRITPSLGDDRIMGESIRHGVVRGIEW